MIKVAGIFTFIGCTSAFISSIYGVIFNYSEYLETEDYKDHYLNYTVLFLIPLIVFSFGIYFTIKTKFGSKPPSILDNLDKENEIIKKKIERKELLAKLEAIENKENN